MRHFKFHFKYEGQTECSLQAYSGFTLIEILIAIFIFSIIMVTVFGSFNSFIFSAESINKRTEISEMMQNCFDRMVLDLKSLHISHPPGYDPPDYNDLLESYRIVGDNVFIDNQEFSKIRFTSLAHLFLKENTQSRVAEIVYYVHASSDDTFVLRRSDNLFPYKPFEEKGSDPVLCEQIRLFSLKYYDQDGDEYDFWDSESKNFGYATPKAVCIRIEAGDDQYSVLMETMVFFPVCREKID